MTISEAADPRSVRCGDANAVVEGEPGFRRVGPVVPLTPRRSGAKRRQRLSLYACPGPRRHPAPLRHPEEQAHDLRLEKPARRRRRAASQSPHHRARSASPPGRIRAQGRGGAAAQYAKHGALIAAGVALLGGGAWLAIEHAVLVAGMFGMSDRLIGITVIAVGTSAPELITSIVAIRRGHADIGVGNIVGSNIYNVLMITGVAAAVSPIAVGEHVYADYAVMVAFSLALLVALRTAAIKRPFGAALAASYAAYLAFSFLEG